MIKHWAVMKDTGEVIALGESYTECQHKAFMTGRWRDKYTGEFMPAGSNCPYSITDKEPAAAVAMRAALVEASNDLTEKPL